MGLAAPGLVRLNLFAKETREVESIPSVPTGCRSIDAALDGGFRYAEITSIAGAPNTGKTVVRSSKREKNLDGCAEGTN